MLQFIIRIELHFEFIFSILKLSSSVDFLKSRIIIFTGCSIMAIIIVTKLQKEILTKGNLSTPSFWYPATNIPWKINKQYNLKNITQFNLSNHCLGFLRIHFHKIWKFLMRYPQLKGEKIEYCICTCRSIQSCLLDATSNTLSWFWKCLRLIWFCLLISYFYGFWFIYWFKQVHVNKDLKKKNVFCQRNYSI